MMTRLPLRLVEAMPRAVMVVALTCAFLPLLHQLWALMTRGEMHYWLLHDDAYYYARMALSWYQGQGYSFNGVEPSNGFQPLWMLLVTGLACLTGGETRPFFVAYVALVACLNAAILWGFARLFRERLGALSAWLVPLFLMLILPSVFSWGMETLLAVPALYFLVYRLGSGTGSRSQYRQLGVALAWLFLVRLDSLVLLPLLMVWLFWRERARTGELLALCLPVAVTVLLYGVANQLWFDSALPVSTLVRLLGVPHMANFTVYAYLTALFVSMLTIPVFALWLLAELIWGRRPGIGRMQQVAYLFLLALLLQFAGYATLSGWSVRPWYAYCFVAFLLALIVRFHDLTTPLGNTRLRGGRRLARLLLWLIMAVTVIFQLPALMTRGSHAQDFVARNYLDARAGVFAGKTVIMGDRAGSLGFWAPRMRIVQTEGQVMSRGYVQARHDGRGADWIDAHYRVNELVVDRPWLPTMNYGGDRVYLIVEPVQAMLWQDRPLVYCFPQFAVLSESHGDDFVRIRFDYDERMTCPAAMMTWLNDVNRRGQLFALSFTMRPEGILRSLRQLDFSLAARWQPPPRVITQSVADPE